MFDRRTLLVSAAAMAAAPMAAAAPAASPSQRLQSLFDGLVDESLTQQPELATTLGLDTGVRADLRRRTSDASLKGIADAKRLAHLQRLRLEAFDASGLTGLDRVNYDIVLYGARTADEAAQRYAYGPGGAGAPYPVCQLQGAYVDKPDFLASQQPVESAADAEAYLDRLHGFAVTLDQECEGVRHDAGLGVIPPDFVLDKTLMGLGRLRAAAPDQSGMAEALTRKAKDKGLAGDWGARAAAMVEREVYPALDRQMSVLKGLRERATHDAGVWKLPDGERYYADSLSYWTTTSMAPEEIHRTGLDLLAELTAACDAQMKALGLTTGTVAERFRALREDRAPSYPDSDDGRAKLLADLNAKVAAVSAKLPDWFGALPKAGLEIRRIPPYMEVGQPGGYYNPGSLDGARAGAYYINLRDMAHVQAWTLASLTFHEGIPGHHLQLSLQQGASLPLIRKLSFFSAYIEGWAHYAERLADEMGMYADDPMGRIGYYRAAMLRAGRLVADSGLHAKRWTREQAIELLAGALGDKGPGPIAEVEHYCVIPGQACAYALGKIGWLKNRDKAKAALGDRFDIRKFHDAGLLMGAMPLAVLDKVIDWYIAETKGS